MVAILKIEVIYQDQHPPDSHRDGLYLLGRVDDYLFDHRPPQRRTSEHFKADTAKTEDLLDGPLNGLRLLRGKRDLLLDHIPLQRGA